jgi:hypothetical protein
MTVAARIAAIPAAAHVASTAMWLPAAAPSK